MLIEPRRESIRCGSMPSWWVRALREESPAVRRLVSAAAPDSVRDSVQAGLLLDNDDLRTDRTPDPEVLAWVMSLWSERLVGGGPERDGRPAGHRGRSSGLSPRDRIPTLPLRGIIKVLLAGWAADRSRGERPARAR